MDILGSNTSDSESLTKKRKLHSESSDLPAVPSPSSRDITMVAAGEHTGPFPLPHLIQPTPPTQLSNTLHTYGPSPLLAPEPYGPGRNIREWLQDLSLLIVSVPPHEHVCYLLRFLSPHARRLAFDAGLTPKSDFQKASEVLLQLFASPDASALANQRFATLRQRPGQSVDDFAHDLRRLAAAAFTNLPESDRDRFILHQFITGLRDRTASGVLLLHPPASLSSAIQQCRLYEECHSRATGSPRRTNSPTRTTPHPTDDLPLYQCDSRITIPDVLIVQLSDHKLGDADTTSQDVCRTLDVNKTRTTPYHPEGNGLVERTNRTLHNLLLAFCKDNHEHDWDTQLPFCLMAYRSSIHSSTGFTPHYLWTGRDLRLPVDLQHPLDVPDPTPVTTYASQLRETIRTAYNAARETLGASSNHQKTQCDRRSTGTTHQIGDLVMHHNPIPPRGVSAKFHYPWQGPFVILDAPSPTTNLLRDASQPHAPPFTTNFNKLKPYHGRLPTCTPDSLPIIPYDQVPPAAVEVTIPSPIIPNSTEDSAASSEGGYVTTIFAADEDIQEGQMIVLLLLYRKLNVREDGVEMFFECQYLIPFDDDEGVIHIPSPEFRSVMSENQRFQP
nr:unnamed protein product [Spirometra erinaceieuropaei]